MAVVSNLFIDKGTDYSVVVVLLGMDRLPIDLTDYDVRGTFRQHYESKTTYELSVEVYIDEESTPGLVKITIPHDLSKSLKYNRYVYNIEIVNKYSGEVKRVLEGLLSFSPSVI